jgi:hypothetical protein
VHPNIAGAIAGRTFAVRERTVVAGLPELDEVLPLGGLLAGSLMDLHAEEGTGAVALALRIAAHQQIQAARDRNVVFVDATGDFYPQAAAQAGVDLGRLIVLRASSTPSSSTSPSPPSRAHKKWLLACLDETLRSRAIGAVVARVQQLDAPSSHRLRVAAESGGGLGLFVRPVSERTAVSAAAVRLLVAAEPPRGASRQRGLTVEPLRVRGGVALGPWHLRVP